MREVLEVVNVLDVADLVVREVQAAEGGKGPEVSDVRDEVVVELELGEGRCEGVGQAVDGLDQVLAEAETGEFGEAFETEGGDGGDAGVLGFNFLGRCQYKCLRQQVESKVWGIPLSLGPRHLEDLCPSGQYIHILCIHVREVSPSSAAIVSPGSSSSLSTS